MKISGIYRIESKFYPKRTYIGSSVDIHKRWHQHLNVLRANKHHSQKLQRHYNKYGESDLQFSILLGCDEEDLAKVEQFFLDAYPLYFNISNTTIYTYNRRQHVLKKRRILESHWIYDF